MDDRQQGGACTSYQVGYARPPKANQFQKGKSGNPKGRPKGAKSISQILKEMGRQQVRITTNGRARHISKLELVFLQLTNKATAGDLKAIRELLSAFRTFAEPEVVVEDVTVIDGRDSSVMSNILKRLRKADIASGTEVSQAVTVKEVG